MALRKHKLIALATSSVVVGTSLVTAGAIVSSRIAQNMRKIEANKQKLHVASNDAFEWSEDGKTINGFAKGTKKSKIKEMIEEAGNVLAFPKCQSIGAKAFDYAFNIAGLSNFTIKFDKDTQYIGDYAFHGNSKITAIEAYDAESATTATWNVVSIGMCAFDRTGITSFTIPLSCTSIGERAFYSCTSLGKITLENRIKLLDNVGSHAFEGIAASGDLVVSDNMSDETANAVASDLSTVEQGSLIFGDDNWKIKKNDSTVTRTKTIPPSYLQVNNDKELEGILKRGTIGNYTHLYIPSEVESIANNAFYQNTTLESVVFETNSKCNKIGNRAFSGCTNLCKGGTLTLPESLTSIGVQAFYECNQIDYLDMSKIYFGNRSRSFSIGEDAFAEWQEFPTASKHVTLPSAEGGEGGLTAQQVQKIFTNSLKTTGNLSANWFENDSNPISEEIIQQYTKTSVVKYDGNEEYYYSIDGFDWSQVKGQTFDTYEIPAKINGVTVVSIRNNANYDPETGESSIDPSIVKIDMSKTEITTIGENAFRNSGITQVVFSDSTETIGANAFQDCKNLEGIQIPPSIKKIEISAFQGCDNAYYLDLSKLDKAALIEIIESQSTDSPVIEAKAFEGFGILQQAGGTIIWADDVDDETKRGIEAILVGAGLPSTWIKDDIEDGYTGGIPIEYESNTILKIVKDEAAGTNTLVSIDWTVLDKYISDVQSQTGVAITSLPLIIPNSVTHIADDFFKYSEIESTNLSKINKLSFQANSKCVSIGARAFEGAINFLGSLTIPETVTTVSESAFDGCSGFSSTLTLPKTIDVNSGLGVNAFKDCQFDVLNLSAWDEEYVTSWSDDTYPISNATFGGWIDNISIMMNEDLGADELEIVKDKLSNPGLLNVGSLGINLLTYESRVKKAPNPTGTLEYFIDTDENRQSFTDYYINWLHNGFTDQETSEVFTGDKILENDLYLTMQAAAINSPALAASEASMFANISNVSIHGPYISFDVTANINVYSDTYALGYVVQLSTSVHDLKITSIADYAKTDIKQEFNQTGIVFESSANTWFETLYDKQYTYRINAGKKLISTVVDITNTSGSFEALEQEFRDTDPILADDESAVRLHEEARSAFKGAPSLFGALFGAYDYTSLYNLSNGNDEYGVSYTPYMTTSKNAEDKLQYQYKPLRGKLRSVTLARENIYADETNESGIWAGNDVVYATNVGSYKNYVSSRVEEETFDETMSMYKHVMNEDVPECNYANGKAFREDILYSISNAINSYITAYKEKCDYIERGSIKFIKLKDTPVLQLVNDHLIANFGIDVDLYIHDKVFKTALDQSGNEVSGYTKSIEVRIPLIFRNIVLNGRYSTESGINGIYWSIFNTDAVLESGFNPEIECLTSTETSEGIELSSYLRMLSYDSTTGTFSHTTAAEFPGTTSFAEVLQDIQGKTPAEVKAYMQQAFPALSFFNFLDTDYDGANTHICLRYNTKALKDVTFKD